MRIVNANRVQKTAPMLLLFMSCLVGCGSALQPVSPGWSAWVRREGGLRAGADQARAASALARLARGECRGVSVRVLDCEQAGAYTWQDGSIFVTAGLVHLLDDDQLTAALAHEMGHLCVDGRLEGVAMFAGSVAGGDIESRADAAGVRILRDRGLATGALRDALQRVRDIAGTPPGLRAALDERIKLLNSPTGR